MSVPTAPAANPSRPRDSGLRPIALAVLVLAVLDALATLGHAGLLLAAERSEAVEIAAQLALLVAAAVSSLLAVAVVLLVRRTTTAEGRTPAMVLLALGLLSLALLATPPLSSALTNVLLAALSPTGLPGPTIRLSPLATDALSVLCTLALGLLALLLAVRGKVAPRTGPSRGRPTGLAAALCGLAVAAALLLPVHVLVYTVPYSSAIALLASVPALLRSIAQVLLFPVGALLIARAAAGPRRLTWAVLIVLWVGGFLSTLAIRVLLLQLALGAEVFGLWFGLWNGLSTTAQALAAVITVVLSVVVLVQVRAARHDVPADTGGSVDAR